MSWIDIGAPNGVPLRGARRVKTPPGGPLPKGCVHDRNVTCPRHDQVCSRETGEVQGAGEPRIETHPVRIEAARVLLDGTRIGAARSAA